MATFSGMLEHLILDIFLFLWCAPYVLPAQIYYSPVLNWLDFLFKLSDRGREKRFKKSEHIIPWKLKLSKTHWLILYVSHIFLTWVVFPGSDSWPLGFIPIPVYSSGFPEEPLVSDSHSYLHSAYSEVDRTDTGSQDQSYTHIWVNYSNCQEQRGACNLFLLRDGNDQLGSSHCRSDSHLNGTKNVICSLVSYFIIIAVIVIW